MYTIDDPEVAGTDLSPMFGTTFRQQRLMDAHHPGQASWVWLVDTTEGPYIVRTSRFNEPPLDEDFWQGAWRLFGANPVRFHGMIWADRVLRQSSPIPLPQILRQEVYQNRPYLIMEYLPGFMLESFTHLSKEGLRAFGKALATIHAMGSTLDSREGEALSFHARTQSVMAYLVDRFYSTERACRDLWVEIAAHVKNLPHEDFLSPILLDMDPSQFLTDGRVITALVDTELYVMAPRHLELIGLEYLLDATAAGPFREGYEAVLPMPQLIPVRHTYRFLLRLLSFQGSVAWDRWMNQPILF